MCEFCSEHGEGKKWYLSMENYSKELREQNNSAEFAEKFIVNFEEKTAKGVAKLDAIKKYPLVYRLIRKMLIDKQKANHWGQIVPIEDVEKIIDMQDSIVRLPCVCRKLTTGREVRYCFGIGIDPSGILGKYPDYSNSFESLNKEEAKKMLQSFDRQGLIHSIWTFKTHYIGGICNCDKDCMAYRIQVKTDLTQVMFRAEYVALVDWDLCNGCKKCVSYCQFGAFRYSNAMKRVSIDTKSCYGCGLCRVACSQNAITLKNRTDFAEIKW
jgi:NAD-dependent dihydropyrimidine dehydrogenase PreA subunit